MATALQNLKSIRQEAIQNLIKGGLLSSTRIYVGMSTCEIAAGSKEVWDVFNQEIEKNKIADVQMKQKGCAGRCNLEPTVEVLQVGKIPFKYTNVDKVMAEDIVRKHLIEIM